MSKLSTLYLPRLRAGDCLGIFAPAGQIIDTKGLERGVRVLKDMGFEVKLPRDLWPGTGYLADTDKNRANEFHRMWADPEVSALLALRGGFGCLRMLSVLDFEELGRLQKVRRKTVIGFSDLTVLHHALRQRCQSITLHGPMLTTLGYSDRASLEKFYHSLTGGWDKPIRCPSIEVLRGGDQVKGAIIGGNLSSIISLLGTKYHPEFAGSILFLEDVGEPLYRLDRMLSQLGHCGIFDSASAIILGDFKTSIDMDTLESIRFHEEIWKRVLELSRDSRIPVWGNFPVGHGPANLTIPHGAAAVLDSSKAELIFA